MSAFSIDLKEMGKRIRKLRRDQQKTQEVFAESIHISTSYLALIEAGKRTASLDVIAQIAIVCQVQVDDLLFGSTPDLPSSNDRRYCDLSRSYSEEQVKKALELADFYLKLENSRA